MKAFDIYLANRFTECDLFITSLSYLESISMANQIVLKDYIEEFETYKYLIHKCDISTTLSEKLDLSIKKCYAKLNKEIVVDSSLHAGVNYSFIPKIDSLCVKNQLNSTSKILYLCYEIFQYTWAGFDSRNLTWEQVDQMTWREFESNFDTLDARQYITSSLDIDVLPLESLNVFDLKTLNAMDSVSLSDLDIKDN